MIVYLDASALVKRDVAETGSAEVGALIEHADAVGTAIVSRAEVAAAFAKATRMQVVTKRDGAAALYWQDMLGERVVMATYDRQSWLASKTTGLTAWPEGLA